MKRVKHKHKKKSKSFPIKRVAKVTFIYFVLFMASFGMIDYYADMAYNFALIFGISLLLAMPLGLYHVLKGKRSHIDDVSDELL